MGLGKRFSIVYFLVAFTLQAFASNELSKPFLLDADETTAEWVYYDSLAYVVGQNKLTLKRPYDLLNPDEMRAAYERQCRFVDLVRNKISQIDIEQNTKYARCGFKRALPILESIACQANEGLNAAQMRVRDRDFLRATAIISLSKVETLDGSCP